MKTYRFANPEQTTIVVTDETDGSQIFVPTDPGNRDYQEFLNMAKVNVWRDGEIVEVDAEELNLPGPSELPVPPAVYSKRKLLGAMTDAEYEVFETIEKQQPKRKQRMFKEATELNDADPDFGEFKQLLEFAFPNGRAAELLAAAKIN